MFEIEPHRRGSRAYQQEVHDMTFVWRTSLLGELDRAALTGA